MKLPNFQITAARPAAFRKAVIFCCDGGYLPFALHAASRVAALCPDRDFDICIVDEAPPTLPESLAGVGIRACGMDTQGIFLNRQRDRRRNASAFYRMALPVALRADYDRILYLDADIHVQRGAFSALLDVDLGPAPLAAVLDNQQWRTPNLKPDEWKIFDLPRAPYFNSGVLLMNVESWNAQDITAKAVHFLLENWDRLPRNDQAVLNCVLHRNWVQLSPVWNWQYSVKSRLFEAMVTANIIHFIGSKKPWKAPAGTFPPRFAVELFTFLDERMPGHGIARPALEGPQPMSRSMRSMLALHLWERRVTQRYFDKFDNELSVVT
ncbi:MAG: glycosyltransferase family 8 protein [Pseudomonadota bacterium]